MRYKVIFVALLLFVLINVACVSAIDNHTVDAVGFADDSSAQVVMNEETGDNFNLSSYESPQAEIAKTNGDVLEVSEEDILSASSSLSQLSSQISRCSDGDTLRLETNYEYQSGDTLEGIKIQKDRFTIDGQYHTIDGKGVAAIFDIYQFERSITVTLKNINFVNADRAVDFGADTFGIVENCNFTHNKGVLGTSIYSADSLKVNNCNFYDNEVYQGVIYAKDALTITNCEFKNNYVAESDYQYQPAGGAIYHDLEYYSEEYTAQISDCKFINCTSKYGGAVYSQSSLNINHCEFIDNHAREKGGAIFSKRQVDITDSLFDNNSARTVAGIYSEQSVTFKNSEFLNNHVSGGTAVFYVGFDATVEGCRFINNTAGSDTGVGYVSQEATIKESSFINNTAGSDSGVFKVLRKGTYNDCNFTGNKAKNGNAGAVNALNNFNSYFTNCRFINNSASGSGGAVAVNGNNEAQFTGCTFTNNSAMRGGAIYVAGNGLIKQSGFTSNCATDEGGAVYFKTTGTTRDNTFTSNCAEIGGAITVYGSLSVTWDRYENNFAPTGVNNIALRNSATITVNGATPRSLGPFRILNLKLISILNNVYCGQKEIITVTLDAEGPKINGDVAYIEIGGVKYTGDVIDGVATIEVSNLDAGTYSAYVTDTNENFTKPHLDIQFSVLKSERSFEVGNITDIAYGESEVLTVTFDKNVTGGYVSIMIDGHEYRSSELNGNSTEILIPDLNAGHYVSYMVYNGKNYCMAPKAVEFNVSRLDAHIDIEAFEWEYEDSVKILVKIYDDAGLRLNQGEVIFKSGNVKYLVPVKKHVADLVLYNLTAGDYDYEVFYDGGVNYNNDSGHALFTVPKKTVSIKVNTENITCGEKERLNISISDDDGPITSGAILYTINGFQYMDIIRNQTLTIVMSDLDAGIYSGNVTYLGGGDYESPTVDFIFEVAKKKVDFTFNLTNITYGEVLKVYVNVTCNDSAMDGGKMVITIKSKKYDASVVNGTAEFEIPMIDAGEYVGIISYDGGINYTDSAKAIEFRVSKLNAQILAKDGEYVINCGGKYSVTLKDSEGKSLSGKKVTFTLNGKDIGSANSDANGVATIDLTASILKAAKSGTKNLVIGFNSDSNYNAVSSTVKINVNKATPKITAKNKKFKKSKKTKKYQITLKDAGKKAIKKVKVTLKVKGKTYSAKTNSKGKATFKITKLTKKGKHKATITFKGNSYYKKATKKVKITVKQ